MPGHECSWTSWLLITLVGESAGEYAVHGSFGQKLPQIAQLFGRQSGHRAHIFVILTILTILLSQTNAVRHAK